MYPFLLFLMVFLLQGCMRQEEKLATLRMENAENDWEAIVNTPPLDDKPLSLNDILERVLAQNLELRVKELEYEYQTELVTGAKLKMIPPLVVTGEVSGRNRNTGLFSTSLEPGVPPAPPSISSEQHVNRYDLTFTWNLLDFGVSYYRARQMRDTAVIKQMEYFKVKQRLIQDTVEQYWKAQTALRGLLKSREIIQDANQFAVFIDEQVAKQILPLDKGLFFKRQILRQEVQMQLYQNEYHASMLELAKLMGLNQAHFILFQESFGDIEIELPAPDVLENLALLNRPELYGLDMKQAATRDEAKAALLQIFPNITPFIGRFFDSNFFLIYHRWIYGGLRYSWNLLAMPYHMQDYLSEIQHAEQIGVERLAVSIGILAQVNLAWIAYQDLKKEYLLIKELATTSQKLFDAAAFREQYGETSLSNVLVDFRYDALFNDIEAFRAYGALQIQMAQMNTSIGIPFYISTDLSGCDDE